MTDSATIARLLDVKLEPDAILDALRAEIGAGRRIMDNDFRQMIWAIQERNPGEAFYREGERIVVEASIAQISLGRYRLAGNYLSIASTFKTADAYFRK